MSQILITLIKTRRTALANKVSLQLQSMVRITSSAYMIARAILLEKWSHRVRAVAQESSLVKFSSAGPENSAYTPTASNPPLSMRLI